MDKILRYYRNLIKNEYKQLRSEIKPLEYALWWLLRIGMIIGLIRIYQKEPFIFFLTVLGNTAMTFSVAIVRFIFPKIFFIGRLPYLIQRYINISVLAGSFFGHVIPLYNRLQNYDKFLHVIAGVTGVFIGYHLMMCMKHNNERISPFVASFSGFGFSCFLIVGWEIFEFFSDFYIQGSNNQRYNWQPDATMFFFKIFGLGVQNAGQAALYDTMIDMIIGLAGAIIGGIFIWPYVKQEILRNRKRKPSPDELRWERVKGSTPKNIAAVTAAK
jgi:hypothetical protein